MQRHFNLGPYKRAVQNGLHEYWYATTLARILVTPIFAKTLRIVDVLPLMGLKRGVPNVLIIVYTGLLYGRCLGTHTHCLFTVICQATTSVSNPAHRTKKHPN